MYFRQSIIEMTQTSSSILLIDLPTFPKGTVALSLYAVAAAFGEGVDIKVIDLNMQNLETALGEYKGAAPALIGLKVSAQNFHLAVQYKAHLRKHFPETPHLWGGEFPSLEPEVCLAYCDAVVKGSFEPVAEELIRDLLNGELAPIYQSSGQIDLREIKAPRLDLVPDWNSAYRFMGLPMESSRGCTYKCTFCMVHHMQPGYELKPLEAVRTELKACKGEFLNLIDYNFGVHPDHVIQTAALIGESEVYGWMAEMCLESLDNDELLQALADSRCRMIYCGIESIDEIGLRSVNKARTNQVQNYERIINKVQSYGIHVAAGLILGLPGSTSETFPRTLDFFERTGIIYAKLTFITYNPGTKVKHSMERVGSYPNEDPKVFDGNHLSYLANGQDPDVIFRGADWFIRNFYNIPAIVRRSFKLKMGMLERMEWILFNICYRDAYLQWIEEGIFHDENAFDRILKAPIHKGPAFKFAEKALHWVRKMRYRKEKTSPSPVSIPHSRIDRPSIPQLPKPVSQVI